MTMKLTDEQLEEGKKSVIGYTPREVSMPHPSC